MADHSVTQLVSLINQQVESREVLNEYLSKAEALVHVSMGNDFLDYPEFIVHHYLWVLSDIIEQAKVLNEQSLDSLLKRKQV